MLKKNVLINGDDIIVGHIVSKQEYIQNKIKYDIKFFNKELYHKVFLIEKENKSKVLLSSYLFEIKSKLNYKKGVVVIADFQATKTVMLFGTLDNPLDSKSLLKSEYIQDKYYNNNIMTFANWLRFFANINTNIYVISNSTKKFKELIQEQELTPYKFNFINKEEIYKINNDIKPFFTKEDLFSIYIPPIIVSIVLFLLINYIGDRMIVNDIENSQNLQKQKTAELTYKTQEAEDLKNNEYFKNRDYYMKLVERKVYIRGKS